jgi:hypothetical protein
MVQQPNDSNPFPKPLKIPSVVFFSALVLLGCITPDAPDPKDIYIFPEETVLISGVTYNQPVAIVGSQYDGLIIENCTFLGTEGTALTLREADNVIIRNNSFQDILGNGITLDGSAGMSGIQILDNHLQDIWGNGINVKEAHAGVLIEGNTILRSGLDLNGAAQGKPHHGIYMMGPDFLISGNRIDTIINPNGHGISVRSDGRITGNIVSGATKSGISYYSDHPSSGSLKVENNIVYGSNRYGVSLVSNDQSSYHIDSALIRFNTLVTSDQASMKVGSGAGDIGVKVYGNLMLRSDGGGLFLYQPGGDADIQLYELNLQTDADPGFVDYGNDDYHISPGSAAALFDVSGAEAFPADDVDQELRDDPSDTMDNAHYVGADDLD